MQWNQQDSIKRKQIVTSQYIQQFIKKEITEALLQKALNSTSVSNNKKIVSKDLHDFSKSTEEDKNGKTSNQPLLLTEKQRSMIKIKPSNFKYIMTDGVHTFWASISCN